MNLLGWFLVTLAIAGATGLWAYGLGVRRERAKAVRAARVRAATRERRTTGVRLKSVRLSR